MVIEGIECVKGSAREWEMAEVRKYTRSSATEHMPPNATRRPAWLDKHLRAGTRGAKKDFACRLQHPVGHNGNPAQDALPGDVCVGFRRGLLEVLSNGEQ